MLTRKLGKTNEEVSIFGFGGIVVRNMEQKNANEIVAEAVDRGINYFDVAPNYGDAQNRLGPALEPYRKDVTLACKTAKRTKNEAAKELRQSLKLLKTEHIDVYQLHGIDNPEDIKTALGPGGALEAFEEAKKEGLIKYIGFSCHAQQSALKLMNSYDFDTILFPINWCYWLKQGVGEKALKVAKSKNMGRIAIKALAHRKWQENEEKTYPKCWYKPIYDDHELASMALRFTLSQDISLALSPGDARMLRLGLDIMEKVENINLSNTELKELKKKAQNIEPIFNHTP